MGAGRPTPRVGRHHRRGLRGRRRLGAGPTRRSQGWLLALLPAIAAFAAVAGAAVLRRRGRCSPGDLMAAAAGVLLLGLLLFGPRWGDVELLPAPGAATAGELVVWGVVLAAAGAALAWAPSGRPSRPASDS